MPPLPPVAVSAVEPVDELESSAPVPDGVVLVPSGEVPVLAGVQRPQEMSQYVANHSWSHIPQETHSAHVGVWSGGSVSVQGTAVGPPAVLEPDVPVEPVGLAVPVALPPPLLGAV
jgi:hypothetical protein